MSNWAIGGFATGVVKGRLTAPNRIRESYWLGELILQGLAYNELMRRRSEKKQRAYLSVSSFLYFFCLEARSSMGDFYILPCSELLFRKLQRVSDCLWRIGFTPTPYLYQISIFQFVCMLPC